MTAEPLIDHELAAFLQSGISMHIGSARNGVPQLTRAAGCRVSPDGRVLTMFVVESLSRAVLDDLAANGTVAAVFTKPKTHRTVQVKGTDARIGEPGPGDAALVRAQVDAFDAELASIGFPAGLGDTLALAGHDDLVAVTFTPASAFVQTPGPAAGQALKP